ncbi:TIR domain-containing protein [Sneathiella sp.]|uniref:TIR domain-containing protein n=1 Tax=Sneathiella sp. TaxID=1964365 RepID=UPI003561BD54
MTYNIGVFISHSWTYSEHYKKIAEWVFQESWSINSIPILFKDCSVPKDDPIHNASNGEELKKAIYAKISESDVIVIPSGMYANYSNWIKKEIDGAQLYRKPILAVNPYGQERKSGIVLDSAAEGVGWNKKSVVGGIWRLFSG